MASATPTPDATPFTLHPAVAYAKREDKFVVVSTEEDVRREALATETLYVRARGAELLYLSEFTGPEGCK